MRLFADVYPTLAYLLPANLLLGPLQHCEAWAGHGISELINRPTSFSVNGPISTIEPQLVTYYLPRPVYSHFTKNTYPARVSGPCLKNFS
jgi:hypothetical protein